MVRTSGTGFLCVITDVLCSSLGGVLPRGLAAKIKGQMRVTLRLSTIVSCLLAADVIFSVAGLIGYPLVSIITSYIFYPFEVHNLVFETE